MLTPSVDMFSTNVDGIFAASAPAPATSPRSSSVRARPSSAKFNVAGIVRRRRRDDRRVESNLRLGEQLRRRELRSDVDRRRTHALAEQHDAVSGVRRRLANQLDSADAGRHLGVRPATKLRGDGVARGARRRQRRVDRRLLVACRTCRCRTRRSSAACGGRSRSSRCSRSRSTARRRTARCRRRIEKTRIRNPQ